MVGKTWRYDGAMYLVKKVTQNGVFKVETDKRCFKFEDKEDLDYFVANCHPVQGGSGFLIVADKEGGDVMQRLLGGLVEDFERLEKDPSYVGQAKQRSNHINVILNIAKTKLAMERHNNTAG